MPHANSSDFLTSLFSLRDKVAVVIGGTGELCGAMAEGLARAGAEAVIVGRNQDKANARIARIDAAGGRAWFHAAEATSKAEIETLLDAVLRRSGRVDIVVNGAGINSATPFFDIAEDEFDRIVRVNLKGVFFGCQVFGKHLVEAGHGGSIINIGSMSGLVPLSRVFTYSATKSAVHNLSLNLAREWAPHRVRVNVLVPGFLSGGAESKDSSTRAHRQNHGAHSDGPVRRGTRARSVRRCCSPATAPARSLPARS